MSARLHRRFGASGRWVGAFAAVFGLALVGAVLAVAAPGTDLPAEVRAALPRSGVDSQVTAVLLAFRAYDTLLEVAVLLVAAIVPLLLRPDSPGCLPEADAAPVASRPATTPDDDPVLGALVRALVPTLLLVAIWLLWAGKSLPGGAFQAGAVLASIAVLLDLHGSRVRPELLRWPLRLALVAGLAVFLFVGGVASIAGHPWLAYPPGLATTLIVLLEAVLAATIGVSLYVLFHAGARR